jgi:hypothetical protein
MLDTCIALTQKMILCLIISMNDLNVVDGLHPVPDHVRCGGDILINLYTTSDVCVKC